MNAVNVQFRLFRRQGVFCCEDTATGKQTSLRTRDEAEARPQLRECRARLMYLACWRDEVVRRASLAEVLAIAPHTQVAEIEGSHLALFTNPAQSAAHLVRFLQER